MRRAPLPTSGSILANAILTESSYDFGSVEISEFAQTQFVITNQGTADLVIQDIYSTSEQFTYGETDLPVSIPSEQTYNFTVIYEPVVESPDTTRLRITSNDPSQPIAVIVISGIGINTTGVEDDLRMNQLPDQYRLHQNYPNPFNPETTIAYQIPVMDSQPSSFVSLKVFNMLGQEVRTLVNALQEPGNYRITWTAADETGNLLPSGIYAYRLQAGEFMQSKRMVYVR